MVKGNLLLMTWEFTFAVYIAVEAISAQWLYSQRFRQNYRCSGQSGLSQSFPEMPLHLWILFWSCNMTLTLIPKQFFKQKKIMLCVCERERQRGEGGWSADVFSHSPFLPNITGPTWLQHHCKSTNFVIR